MSPPGAGSATSAYLSVARDLRTNPGQWNAYESTGNCVVLAGPGSGKTKVLTIKLARMLAKDVRMPRGIACITYSNECARELKRRLDKLGVSQCPNLFIGTIHSFCLVNILKPYGTMAGLELPEPIVVAGPSDQQRFFDTARETVYGRPQGVSRSAMDWARRTHLDRGSPGWRIDEEPVFNVIEAYETELRSAGFIDFDDMVLLGLKLVEQHDWVRKLLRARFPIFAVDEYQDLGLALHRIVMTLCLEAGVRLFAVGDPYQSIYGWTGAQPELLRKLANMDEVEDVQLRMNYRCGATIVEASEIVLDLDRGQFETPDDAPMGTVDFYECPEGIEDQAERICTEIIPGALSRGPERNLGDIAILYLTRHDGDVIASSAREAGFDFIRIDRNAPYRKTPLTRWLEDCAAWCSGGWREGDPRLSSLIRTWLMFNGGADCDDRKALELKRQLVRFLWTYRDADSSLEQWLYDFDARCLQEAFHPDCGLREEYQALDQLLCACVRGGEMDNFTVAALGGQGGSPSHLNLITLYSAKGREFEVVVMMGMDQGRIPWTTDSPQRKAEKRRLFYVGVTRAKHQVHMTYSGWYKYRGTRWSLGPSEFLEHLRSRLQE